MANISRPSRSPYRQTTSAFILQLLLLSAASLTIADDRNDRNGDPPPKPCAIGVKPSSKWIGIDGLWSAFDVYLGGGPVSQTQTVSLLVSTALSESWVVETSGCVPTGECRARRGGVFSIDSAASNGDSAWLSLGPFASGLQEPGLPAPNVDYGLATMTFPLMSSSRPSQGRPIITTRKRQSTSDGPPPDDRPQRTQIRVNRSLVGGYNDTTYFNGFIGVGGVDSDFGDRTMSPLIRQLAEYMGTIPSHSYGYTAGASYKGANGVPASLTLGGYDMSRIAFNRSSSGDNSNSNPNSNSKPLTFNLSPDHRQPELLLRSITATAPSSNSTVALPAWTQSVPDNSSTAFLTNITNPSTSLAVVDSSTPFLWMTQDICDRFISTLGLVMNKTLNLYQFPSTEMYRDYLGGNGPSFTFSFTSLDNPGTDGFMNLTVSSSAFALNASYPYAPTMNPDDPPEPYFPLKCLPQNGKEKVDTRIVIGRSFLQEVYMIVNYDANHFSLLQARFTSRNGSSLDTNVHLVDIPRSPTSPYPIYKGGSDSSNDPNARHGLSSAAIAGTVVGSFAAGTLAAFALWFFRRRRNQEKRRKAAAAAAEARAGSGDDENGHTASAKNKDGTESMTETEPSTPTATSPMERIFSFIGGRHGRRASGRSRDGGLDRLIATSSPTSSRGTDEGDPEKNAIEVAGSFSQPVEVGADAQHARYELPVPLPPVELDATAGGVTAAGRRNGAGNGRNHKIEDALIGGGVIDDFDDGHGYCDYDDATAVLGNDGVEHLTAYEVARRRMQRQLRGPVPTYEPPTDPSILRGMANNNVANSEEVKSAQDISAVAHYRAPPPSISAVSSQTATDNTSATSPTVLSSSGSNHSDSMSMLPSPMTPSSAGWPGRSGSASGSATGSGNGTFDLPSPMTMATPFPPIFFQGDGNVSDEEYQTQQSRVLRSEPSRTTIDPTRVVCLGPLPEDVMAPVAAPAPVPAPRSVPATTPPRRNVSSSSESVSVSSPTVTDIESTLGTNYTLEEEARLRALKNEIEQEKVDAVAQTSAAAQTENGTTGSMDSPPAERIDAGFDLVHVPQLAARRYSWEGQEGEEDKHGR